MAKTTKRVSLDNFIGNQADEPENEVETEPVGVVATPLPDPYVDPHVPDPDEPTIKLDLSLVDPEEPTLPGFMASDEPLPLPTQPPASQGANAHAPSPLNPEGNPGDIQPSYIDTINDLSQRQRAAHRPPDTGIIGDILAPERPSGPVTYESRIRILDAWQYSGQVAGAPDWIDRNWIGWADEDPVRRMEASPCLRVPLGNASVLCRPGDYVVRQSTLFDNGLERLEIEVWERAQFQRLFLAVPKPNKTKAA